MGAQLSALFLHLQDVLGTGGVFWFGCCCCFPSRILWRGLLRGEGIKINDKCGFCLIKCHWGSDCGYDVPSMMNVLDLEELNGCPGDKRKM